MMLHLHFQMEFRINGQNYLQLVSRPFLSVRYHNTETIALKRRRMMTDAVTIPVRSPPNISLSGQHLSPQQPTGQDCLNVYPSR